MAVKTVNATTTIHDIPEDPLLAIFNFLDLRGCLAARCVCKLWTQLIQKPSTMLSRHTQADAQLRDRVTVIPIVSDWQELPDHWLFNDSETLHFSSVCHDMISVSPRSGRQSSKFFSFKRSIPFRDRGIVLAQHESTYFLIPQLAETANALPNRLKSLSSSRLIIKNLNNPHYQTISLLDNVPSDEKKLISYQIKYCFPFSKDKVAILIQKGVISFWDLNHFIPVCYNKLELPPICSSSSVYQVGDYLLVKNQLISLNNLSIEEHKFDFDQYSTVKMCGSFVCAGTKEGPYTLFVLCETGSLQIKWKYSYAQLNYENLGDFIRLDLESMSEKFVVLSYRHQLGFALRIFNMDGDFVHSDAWSHRYMLRPDPLFAQIFDNLLVFKVPGTTTLTFRCIFTKAYKATSALADLYDYTRAWHGSKDQTQDIRFVDGKLIVLLVTESPMKFRLVQFDPPQLKIMQVFNWASAGLKQVYNKCSDKA